MYSAITSLFTAIKSARQTFLSLKESLFKILLAYIFTILKQICLDILRKIFTHKFYSTVSADKAIRKQTWLSALKELIYCIQSPTSAQLS